MIKSNSITQVGNVNFTLLRVRIGLNLKKNSSLVLVVVHFLENTKFYRYFEKRSSFSEGNNQVDSNYLAEDCL